MSCGWLVLTIAASSLVYPSPVELPYREYARQIDYAQHTGDVGLRERITKDVALALSEAHRIQQPARIAELLHVQWLLLLNENQIQKGTTKLHEALNWLENLPGVEDQRTGIKRDLAYSLTLMGQLGQATRLLRQIIVYSLNAGDPVNLERDLYSIADAYLKGGETDIAKRYFEQVIDVKSPDPINSEAAKLKIASISRINNDVKAALIGHTKALEYFQQRGLYRSIVAHIELAKDHLALGDYLKAQKHALEAVRDNRGLTEQRIDASLSMLDAAMGLDEKAKARFWIEQTQQLIQVSKGQLGSTAANPLRQLTLVTKSIELDSSTKDLRLIDAHLRQGMELVNEVSESLGNDRAARLAWTARVSPFIDAVVEALYPIQPMRIAYLLETLYATSPTQTFGDGEDTKALAALDRYLTAERRLVEAEIDPDGEFSNGVINELLRNRDIAREQYLADESIGSDLQLEANKRTPTPYAIPEDHIYLRYFVRDKISLVVAHTNNTITVRSLPSAQRVRRIARNLQAALSPGSSVSRRKKLTWLREARRLLPHDLLSDTLKTIVIATDDVVHGIPFNAINLSDKGYEPLFEKYSIVRTDSVANYFSTRAPDVPSNSNLFVFADPTFSEDKIADSSGPETLRGWTKELARLPHSNVEAQTIANLFPNRVTLALGQQAKRQSLLSSGARDAMLLHIATHGYYNPRTPNIVGIATASAGEDDSSFLGVTELLSHMFSNQLVIISGCETMLGRRYDGLGVQGLPQALMARGVDSVVGTLWPVPDRATAAFMGEFYTSLIKYTGNVSKALSSARAKLHQQGQYSDPTYWAAFVFYSTHQDISRLSLH